MIRKNLYLLFLLVPVLLLWIPGTVHSQEPGPEKKTPVSDLESELSAIEGDLTDLEQKVENLLEDLVTPRVSSIVIFFSTEELTGLVPSALEVRLDKDPLLTRELSETDRLVLDKGGAIEVFSGTIEPAPHTLTVSCFLSVSQSRQSPVLSTVKKTFKIVPVRASTNFVEISLAQGKDTGKPSLILTARHWHKEP